MDADQFRIVEPFLHVRRTLSIEVEVEVDEDTRLVVSTVEVWMTMVVIHSAVIGPWSGPGPSPELRGGSPLAWECADNLGTCYTPRGMGGAGSFFVKWQTAILDGTVPEEAAWLELTSMLAPNHPIRVDL